MWLPTPSLEKASDAGGIALDAERAVMLLSGHVPRAPGRFLLSPRPASLPWQWFRREQGGVAPWMSPTPRPAAARTPGEGTGP